MVNKIDPDKLKGITIEGKELTKEFFDDDPERASEVLEVRKGDIIRRAKSKKKYYSADLTTQKSRAKYGEKAPSKVHYLTKKQIEGGYGMSDIIQIKEAEKTKPQDVLFDSMTMFQKVYCAFKVNNYVRLLASEISASVGSDKMNHVSAVISKMVNYGFLIGTPWDGVKKKYEMSKSVRGFMLEEANKKYNKFASKDALKYYKQKKKKVAKVTKVKKKDDAVQATDDNVVVSQMEKVANVIKSGIEKLNANIFEAYLLGMSVDIEILGPKEGVIRGKQLQCRIVKEF